MNISTIIPAAVTVAVVVEVPAGGWGGDSVFDAPLIFRDFAGEFRIEPVSDPPVFDPPPHSSPAMIGEGSIQFQDFFLRPLAGIPNRTRLRSPCPSLAPIPPPTPPPAGSGDHPHLTCVLAAKPIRRERMQLVAMVCLIVAAKYEEVYAPRMKDYPAPSVKSRHILGDFFLARVCLMGRGFNEYVLTPTRLTFAKVQKMGSFFGSPLCLNSNE